MHSLFKCYICILYLKEGKNVLKYDSKEQSLISFICLVIMSCSLSEVKDVIQAILSVFGLVTATCFDFLK